MKIMLNLFRKKDKNVTNEVAKPKTINTFIEEEIITSKTIQADLHKSFSEVLKEFDLKPSKETEVEELRAKVVEFKKENQHILDKIAKLKELNLVNTPSVTQTLKELEDREKETNEAIMLILNQIKESEKIQKLIGEYSLKYPTYKFIDEKTMLSIMTKYDLYLGDAFIYGKEIPDENLAIISNFSAEIKESEERFNLLSYRNSLSTCYIIKKQEIIEKDFNVYIRDPFNNIEKLESSHMISKLKIIAPISHFSIPTFKHYNAWDGSKDIPIMKIDTKTRKFVFSTDRLNELEAEKRKVLDPIACLEVEGGYIILTAWDEEADIPEIKNTFLN